MKAVSIRVEFEDGSISSAEGEHAAEVWKWLTSCESFVLLRGTMVKIPCKPMNRTEAAKEGTPNG